MEERLQQFERDLAELKKAVFKLPLDPSGIGALNQAFLPSNFDKFNVTNLHLKTGNEIEPSVNGQVVYNENAGTPQIQAMIDDAVVDLGATGGGQLPVYTSDSGITTEDGTTISLTTGNGGATSGSGGVLSLIAGDGGNSGGNGGFIDINGGYDDGEGGSLDIRAGAGTIASGGAISLVAGSVLTTGDGGTIEINAGNGSGADAIGGDVLVTLGEGGGSGNSAAGNFQVRKGVGSSGTGKNSSFILNNTGNANCYRLVGQVSTTNATPTTIISGDSPSLVADNTSCFIEARVLAKRTGGTAGTAGDSASYVRRGLYKRTSGTVSLVGSVQDNFTAESQSGWDCTFSVSSNDILLQVTGATDNNVIWIYEITYMTT